jgi:hypothetical protein
VLVVDADVDLLGLTPVGVYSEDRSYPYLLGSQLLSMATQSASLASPMVVLCGVKLAVTFRFSIRARCRAWKAARRSKALVRASLSPGVARVG